MGALRGALEGVSAYNPIDQTVKYTRWCVRRMKHTNSSESTLTNEPNFMEPRFAKTIRQDMNLNRSPVPPSTQRIDVLLYKISRVIR